MSGSRSKKSGGQYDGPGARNIYGKESEQSKERRVGSRKSDVGGEGSTAGELAKSRKKKKKTLKKIMDSMK